MTTSPRTPPRYVPTLTDVVHLPDPAQSMSSKSGDVPAAAIAAPALEAVAASAPQVSDPVPPPCAQDAVVGRLPEGIEEHLVHRVLQRVDLMLDQRLREAIALVMQEQTRSMVPRLREEVESVVRHAVYEAVADELADDGCSR